MRTLLFSVLSLLLSTTAFADHGSWRCDRAERQLHRAQSAFDQAQAMVLNNASLCPGGWNTNAACMYAIANHYNQTVVNLQRAQRHYNFACGLRR